MSRRVTGSTNGVGDAENAHHITVVVQGRDFADEIASPANQRSLLIGQQRIVAIDRLGVREVTRWADLPRRSVLHRHHFGIGLDRSGKIEICEAAGGVSLVRPLEEIPRRGIESSEAGHKRPVGRDLVHIAEIVEEVPGIGDDRTAAFQDGRRPLIDDPAR